MPRNASGTYTLPSGNPVVSGTLIDATWANNTLSDLGNEVTDSLSRSGEGAMLAPLRITDGVQATPALAFSNEPSSGLYRAGSNEWWAVAAGVQNLRFTNTGLTTRAAAGAVGTPSLAAFNDTDTGIYFPGANELAIATGGVGALWVNSSQNVGIGTSSPAAKLESAGTSNGATLELLRLNNIGSGANTQAQINFIAASTSYGTITGGFGSAAPQMTFNLPNATAGNFVWQITSTEQMRLTSTGLGIGTASPSAKLHVVGNQFRQNDATGSQGYVINTTSATTRLETLFGGSSFGIRTGGAASDYFLIDSSGNLGIGTSSPSCKLDVRGQETTNYNTARFLNGIDNQGLDVLCGRALTNGTAAGVASSLVMTLRSSGSVAGVLAFATGNDERGRFEVNGSFLVGTTANPNVLDRSVVIDSGASSLAGVVLQNNTTGRTSTDGSHIAITGADLKVVNLENAPIIFTTNGVDRAQITGAGNFVAGASAALSTTATDGFLYVPTCAGTPTGTPTAISGMAPIVVNTTNNKLYFYSGGAWRDAGP